MTRTINRSTLRRLNAQLSPDEWAEFLADLVDTSVLKEALRIGQDTSAAETVHIWVDGLCSNNGQPGAKAEWSMCQALPAGGWSDQEGGPVPDHQPQTNNTAEYTAVIMALQQARQLRGPVVIHTDSALVVGQLTQNWRINVEHLRALWCEASQLIDEIANVTITKEPRDRIEAVLGH